MEQNRKQIFCTESRISVVIMTNADGFGTSLVIAEQEGEYWFTIGWYKTEAGAIRGAKKQLSALGYTLNA